MAARAQGPIAARAALVQSRHAALRIDAQCGGPVAAGAAFRDDFHLAGMVAGALLGVAFFAAATPLIWYRLRYGTGNS